MVNKKRRFFKKKIKKRKYNKFFSYKNDVREDRNFLYKNFEKSNSYNARFTRSNFSYVNFYKSIMKYCGFNGASFVGSEFKSANLRGSCFKGATFKDVIFIDTKLDKAIFLGASFENVYFIGTSVRRARGLPENTQGITILNALPSLELSKELKSAVSDAVRNQFIKESEVLVLRKKQRINTINLELLLKEYSEEQLIVGLGLAKLKINKNFHTLSYIKSFIKKELTALQTT